MGIFERDLRGSLVSWNDFILTGIGGGKEKFGDVASFVDMEIMRRLESFS